MYRKKNWSYGVIQQMQLKELITMGYLIVCFRQVFAQIIIQRVLVHHSIFIQHEWVELR